jgi:uncharacterized protein YuzE
MKLRYYSHTDSLYVDLAGRPSADSREVTAGVVPDFDAAGSLVSIHIDLASGHLDLCGLGTGERTGRDGGHQVALSSPH